MIQQLSEPQLKAIEEFKSLSPKDKCKVLECVTMLAWQTPSVDRLKGALESMSTAGTRGKNLSGVTASMFEIQLLFGLGQFINPPPKP